MTEYRIARRELDDDAPNGGIPLAEWEAVAAGDASLEVVPAMTGRNPQTGSEVRVPLRGGYRWSGGPPDAMPFWWEHGYVACYSADEATAAKARELARALSATCTEAEV